MHETKLNENDMKLAMSLSMAPTKFDKYIVLLKNDFGYNLTKSNLADVLGVGVQTISRRVKESCDIPNYLRSGEGEKASYIFPTIEVAEYLSNNTIKIF